MAATSASAHLVVTFSGSGPTDTTADFTVSGTFLATANQTWLANNRLVWEGNAPDGANFLVSTMGANPVFDFPISGSLTIENLSDSSAASMSHIWLRQADFVPTHDQVAFKFGESFTWESGDTISLSGSGTIDLAPFDDTFGSFFPGTYAIYDQDTRYDSSMTLTILTGVPEPGAMAFMAFTAGLVLTTRRSPGRNR